MKRRCNLQPSAKKCVYVLSVILPGFLSLLYHFYKGSCLQPDKIVVTRTCQPKQRIAIDAIGTELKVDPSRASVFALGKVCVLLSTIEWTVLITQGYCFSFFNLLFDFIFFLLLFFFSFLSFNPLKFTVVSGQRKEKGKKNPSNFIFASEKDIFPYIVIL